MDENKNDGISAIDLIFASVISVVSGCLLLVWFVQEVMK